MKSTRCFPVTLLLLFVGAVAVRGQATARDQEAAALVAKIYKINPEVKAGTGNGPLPKDGSWGVRPAAVDESPAECSVTGATCREVVYHAGKPEIICTWTVVFPGGTEAPRVVSDNEASAMYMLRIFTEKDKDRPAMRKQTPARMPPIAKVAHMNGSVLVAFVVDRDGKVTRTTILNSTNPMFDRYAMDTVRDWEMSPYVLDGKARPYQQNKLVEFFWEAGA